MSSVLLRWLPGALPVADSACGPGLLVKEQSPRLIDNRPEPEGKKWLFGGSPCWEGKKKSQVLLRQCGLEHQALCGSDESLKSTPETDITQYVNYLEFKGKLEKKNI